MLTLSQQVIFDELAKGIIQELKHIFKTRNIPRTSVRYENGERITSNFSAPVSASGNLIKAVRYEITDTAILIYAPSYVYTLIYGRKPTRGTGNGSVKDSIRKWMDSKGISSTLSSEAEKNQVAYLITRKIHREGNSIYLFSGSNNSGLLNNVLTEALKKEFNNKFTKDLKDGIIQEFNGNKSNT